MPLKLMYITNSEDVAHIAEEAGVDRIFVDMEYIGKTDRQGGMDTVQSRHTADDVRRLAQCLNKAELFVRVNPIHEKTDEYNSSIHWYSKTWMEPKQKIRNKITRVLHRFFGTECFRRFRK